MAVGILVDDAKLHPAACDLASCVQEPRLPRRAGRVVERSDRAQRGLRVNGVRATGDRIAKRMRVEAHQLACRRHGNHPLQWLRGRLASWRGRTGERDPGRRIRQNHVRRLVGRLRSRGGNRCCCRRRLNARGLRDGAVARSSKRDREKSDKQSSGERHAVWERKDFANG